MNIQSAGKTDIGLVRKLNEDSISLREDKRLYIVCDGMGGHNAGEVASSTACELVSDLHCNFYNQLLNDERLRLPRMLPPSTDVLTKSVRIANHCIYKKALADPALSGMGTTIVAIAIEEDIVTVLHVGDSRIYRYYEGELTPLTIDHSWAAELEQTEKITAEEAQKLVNRNVITRALGVKDSVSIDVAVRKVVENDTYILCSDGLCGLVDDDSIRRVISSAKGDVGKTASLLVQLANERGGSDNVSVAAVKITGRINPSRLPELETITIDAEPEEYFAAEEEWTEKTKSHISQSNEKKAGEPRNIFPFAAGLLVVAVIVIIFYVIFKG
jgi:serine/threonine protein phosphatase PrpC